MFAITIPFPIQQQNTFAMAFPATVEQQNLVAKVHLL
jgi:hypothetical protein